MKKKIALIVVALAGLALLGQALYLYNQHGRWPRFIWQSHDEPIAKKPEPPPAGLTPNNESAKAMVEPRRRVTREAPRSHRPTGPISPHDLRMEYYAKAGVSVEWVAEQIEARNLYGGFPSSSCKLGYYLALNCMHYQRGTIDEATAREYLDKTLAECLPSAQQEWRGAAANAERSRIAAAQWEAERPMREAMAAQQRLAERQQMLEEQNSELQARIAAAEKRKPEYIVVEQGPSLWEKQQRLMEKDQIEQDIFNLESKMIQEKNRRFYEEQDQERRFRQNQ